ncbi:MAG: thioredoxin family protein [Candidatus Altimarinota bacterium]
MIDFSLPDPFGKIHSSSDYADRKVLVVIFMCNHCPYIQAVQERLIALQEFFSPTEVQFIGINSNDFTRYPDDSPEAMKKTIAEWGINFPYLIDEEQSVAKAYQAQCTPDIYVFSKTQAPNEATTYHLQPTAFSLAYHGRIDDNWKDPQAVTKQELKEAIESLLKNEKPPEDQKSSMGCSIKWK